MLNKFSSWFKELYQSSEINKDEPKQEKSQSADPGNNKNFHGDEPLQDPELDRFNRWPFAKRIAETIIKRRQASSLVISINGIWGDGKTTVLNFIQRALKGEQNVVTIRFNPWLFGTIEELLKGFFHQLASSIGKSVSTKSENIGEWLKEYGNKIIPVNVGFGPVSVTGADLSKLGESISTVDIKELKERIEDLFLQEDIKIVVFVDDIERLDKEEIRSLFKTIKLTLDFKFTVFILAFDRDLVAAALKEIYPSKNQNVGYDFQEKIIQVPLDLPAADSTELRKLIYEGIEEVLTIANIELDQENIHRLVSVFDTSLLPKIKTPRLAKRYSNALLFVLPILKNEVNPIDLILIEAIRICYPNLYEHIKNNKSAYLCPDLPSRDHQRRGEIQEAYKKIREEALCNLRNTEKGNIENLIHKLFPLTGNMFANQTNWIKNQRICSESYFDRYFSYAIADQDVSDTYIENFLGDLENHSIDEVINQIKEAINRQNSGKFIEKLSNRLERISGEKSRILSCSISRLGGILPHPESMFRAFTTPLGRATTLISKLLQNIDDDQSRFDAAYEIVSSGEPVYYSRECLSTIHYFSDEETLFSDQQLTQLDTLMAERVRDLAEEVTFYLDDVLSEYSSKLIRSWQIGLSRDETNDYLGEKFESNPEEVIPFLKTYLPTSWVSGSYAPQRNTFNVDEYNNISRVVDPEIIVNALTAIFDEDIHEGGIERWEHHNYDVDEYLARRLSYLHRSMQGNQHDNEEE